jgi:hypothetical protein
MLVWRFVYQVLVVGRIEQERSSWERAMKSTVTGFIAIVALSLGLMMPLNIGFGDSPSFEELSAEWWQWEFSIPVSESPSLDETGEKCMVGQRGSEWFLAGNVLEGPITLTCTVPEGTALFSPVTTYVGFSTPNLCGQGSQSIPVEDLRAGTAAFVEGTTELSVEVDGKPIEDIRRAQSKVFAVALPEENVLDVDGQGCPGGAPAGVYSPAVADGSYVRLNPLAVGNHTLRVRSKNPSANFNVDVTYKLTVAPVSLK